MKFKKHILFIILVIASLFPFYRTKTYSNVPITKITHQANIARIKDMPKVTSPKPASIEEDPADLENFRLMSDLSESDLALFLEVEASSDCTLSQKTRCIAHRSKCLRQVDKHKNDKYVECFTHKHNCENFEVSNTYAELAHSIKTKDVESANKELEYFIDNHQNNCKESFDFEPEYCTVAFNTDCDPDPFSEPELRANNTFYCLSKRVNCIVE